MTTKRIPDYILLFLFILTSRETDDFFGNTPTTAYLSLHAPQWAKREVKPQCIRRMLSKLESYGYMRYWRGIWAVSKVKFDTLINEGKLFIDNGAYRLLYEQPPRKTYMRQRNWK